MAAEPQGLVNSTINLSFRYLPRDYVRAVRTHFGSRWRLLFDAGVTTVLAAVGFYLLRSDGDHWTGMVLLGLSAIFALVLIVGLVILPPIVFRKTPKFQDEYSLTFSPSGIQFRTAQIDSQLQWGMYSRALIDAYSYLLYYGPRSYTIIPKRVFQSGQQQAAFERLLAQEIPKIVRRSA
jgi:YcxB-like protein